MSKTGDTILGLITVALQLIKGSDGSNTRRNLRHAHRNYRKIKKIMKKDGYSEKEKKQLEEMLDLLVTAQHKLLK